MCLIKGRIPKWMPKDAYKCPVCRKNLRADEEAFLSVKWDHLTMIVPDMEFVHCGCAAGFSGKKVMADKRTPDFLKLLGHFKSSNDHLSKEVREQWATLPRVINAFAEVFDDVDEDIHSASARAS